MGNNQLVNTIVNKAVMPMLDRQAKTVKGSIYRVDYKMRKVDMVYFEPKTGVRRYRKNVDFPEDGSSIIGKSLECGDEVEVSFRNQSYENPYISKVYTKGKTFEDLLVEKGKTMPKATSLF